ncbi:MAG: GNAT family N-acetyltransferase [Burkholderiales bacterium]|nr:GNAT family N-acetyltransferase [Burkholderiales bacterium]
MRIQLDDLQGPEVHALLEEHMRGMHALSPPESVHALDLNGLRQPSVRFWTAWDGANLLGCGALKQLDAEHAEIKSMRTAEQHLRKGVARALLAHIVEQAQARGLRRLSLETGPAPGFAAAHRLYEAFGFQECGPFAGYKLDPHSVFMTRLL